MTDENQRYWGIVRNLGLRRGDQFIGGPFDGESVHDHVGRSGDHVRVTSLAPGPKWISVSDPQGSVHAYTRPDGLRDWVYAP
jgi:hypothetical protein